MSTSGENIPTVGVCSDFDTRLTGWLRKRHPIKTAESVSAETGLPVPTIRKWLSRESRPGAVAVFRLIGAYGPEFLLAVYPKAPAWLSPIVREQRLAKLDAQIEALKAEREAL